MVLTQLEYSYDYGYNANQCRVASKDSIDSIRTILQVIGDKYGISDYLEGCDNDRDCGGYV